uniref:Uncharacterized protein n=1 Tax=Rhizophora mucronata TaxID=61149 RepID=A0A2P2NM98_RHIMU
MRAQEWLQ